MTTNPFKPGDLVKYTRKFLRSTGQYTNVPINGKVIGVSEGLNFPIVQWCDREDGVPVHPGNLMLYRRLG